MDLLSQPQRDVIRAAIGDVLDTFAKVPVVYTKIGDPANAYMEELDFGTSTDFNLLAVYEATDDIKDKIDYKPFLGLADNSEVRLTFKLEDLVLQGLIHPTEFYPLFTREKDSFYVKGSNYKVVYEAVDGHFEDRGLIVYVWGTKKEDV